MKIDWTRLAVQVVAVSPSQRSPLIICRQNALQTTTTMSHSGDDGF
jgi:hypothetical protein